MTRTSKDKTSKENSRMCSVAYNALKIEATDPKYRQASAIPQQLFY